MKKLLKIQKNSEKSRKIRKNILNKVMYFSNIFVNMFIFLEKSKKIKNI